MVDRAMSTLWRRGATESALLLLAAAVASGVVFGAGVARASSHTSDGQTWVARSDTGTVVQINPVTGEPVTEVDVGMSPGPKQVQQGDGLVLVSDPATGRAVSLDVGRLLVAGSRTDAPGASKQLFADGRAYVADLSTGVVRAVDPLSLGDEGEAYVAGAPLSDVVVDQQGTVWALRTDGTMTSLRWSVEGRRFVVDGSVRVNGAASGAKLVPHPRGVTVFAPGSGAVVQVGTGADVAATVPGMTGDVLAAPSSPQNLSAATVPGRSLAVILSGADVYAAHMAPSGCDDPGRPAVFADRVYVPCTGAGRTVVLGPTGRQAGPDIGSGGDTTPVITQDEDSLVIVEDGGTQTVTVDQRGDAHVADLGADGLPVVTAGTSTDPAAAPAGSPTDGPTASTRPTAAPSDPSSGPAAGPLNAPENLPAGGPGPSAVQAGSPANSENPVVTTVVTSVVRTPAPPLDAAGDGPTGSAPNQPGGATASSGSGTMTSTVTGATAPPSGSCLGCAPATDVVAIPSGPKTVLVSWAPPARAPQQYLIQTTARGELTTADGTRRSVLISGLAPGSALQFVVGADFGPATELSFPSNVVVVAGDGPVTVTPTSRTSTSTTTSPTTSPTPSAPSDPAQPVSVSPGPVTTSVTPSPPTSSTTSTTTPTSTSPTSTSTSTSSSTSTSTSTSTTPTSTTPTSTSTTPTSTTPTTTAPPLVKDPPVVDLAVTGRRHTGGCCSPDAAYVDITWGAPQNPQSAPRGYTVTVLGGQTSPITLTEPAAVTLPVTVGVGTSGPTDREFTVTVTVTADYADGSSPGVSGSADILLTGKQCYRDRSGTTRCFYP